MNSLPLAPSVKLYVSVSVDLSQVSQIFTLYTLNIHNPLCQLYFSNTGNNSKLSSFKLKPRLLVGAFDYFLRET